MPRSSRRWRTARNAARQCRAWCTARTRTPPRTWREGYAFVTGRGQGVLVHVDVGTANTANAMHNAYRSRLPVLLMAGKAPYTANDELVGSRDTYVHFVQEPFDQASLVRPYLKWEWTLPSGVVVKEALRRAYSIMQSEPRGPVYLMMQRETLTQHWSTDEIRRYSADQFAATSGGGADPKLIAALADQAFDRRQSGADHRLCGAKCARRPRQSTRWRNSPASRFTKPT